MKRIEKPNIEISGSGGSIRAPEGSPGVQDGVPRVPKGVRKLECPECGSFLFRYEGEQWVKPKAPKHPHDWIMRRIWSCRSCGGQIVTDRVETSDRDKQFGHLVYVDQNDQIIWREPDDK